MERAGSEYRIMKRRHPPRHSAHSDPALRASLEDRGKKTIGAVPVGPELEVLVHIEVDPLFFQYFSGGPQPELRVTGKKALGDAAVLLIENAARGVDEPPSGL